MLKTFHDSESRFSAEVELTVPFEPAVTMVHGFGVNRDARGLFTDLAAVMPVHASVIRGDFAKPSLDSSRTTAVPLSTQVKRLQEILEYLKHRIEPSINVLIGHSQGSLVAAMSGIEGGQVFLLAPPMIEPYERFINTPGWQRPGSTLYEGGESRLKRSDDTITVVRPDYWRDLRKVEDPVGMYQALAEKNDVHAIFAGADQVLVDEPQEIEGIPSIVIEGADHDFNGEARLGVARYILDHLAK